MKTLERKLRDIMDRDVVTVPGTATFREVVLLMELKRTNGIYVVDAARRPIGIISSQVLLRRVMPDHLTASRDAYLAAFEAPEVFVKRVKSAESSPVSSFMRTPLRTAKEDSSLLQAAVYLTEYRQVPVVDAGGKLVGSVSRTHLKQAISQILQEGA